MAKTGGVGKVARWSPPKKLSRGILTDAAAFALFIGYVLSECSGVSVKNN